jgi:hypothetical protein
MMTFLRRNPVERNIENQSNKALTTLSITHFESSSRPTDHFSKRLAQWLQHLWQSGQRFLWIDQEIKVSQKCDRRGRTYWDVYDPYTQNLISFVSADDVRVWIETRY